MAGFGFISRIAEPLEKITTNERFGYFVVMGLAVSLIIFQGSSSEGQASILSNVLTSYIEETAENIALVAPANQLADINSVFAQSNTNFRQPRPSFLNTIQDNSLVFRSTVLADILDEFSDRGTEIIEYDVQEGDTLSFIASDYGVKVTTIIWANNLRSADEIRPGMTLKIPPTDGVIHKIQKGDTISAVAKKYSADSEKIISFNSLPQEGELQIGSQIIVPGGIMPGRSSGVTQTSAAKRFAYLPSLGDFFALPALGFNWGRIHGRNGVDVANSCGTPIFAAAEGIISAAKSSGWNGGFGKYVKIGHLNNTETVYAHMSKILVSLGERIFKGQQIGVMGSTGRSTGCHVHFEVHGAKNPLAKY